MKELGGATIKVNEPLEILGYTVFLRNLLRHQVIRTGDDILLDNDRRTILLLDSILSKDFLDIAIPSPSSSLNSFRSCMWR